MKERERLQEQRVVVKRNQQQHRNWIEDKSAEKAQKTLLILISVRSATIRVWFVEFGHRVLARLHDCIPCVVNPLEICAAFNVTWGSCRPTDWMFLRSCCEWFSLENSRNTSSSILCKDWKPSRQWFPTDFKVSLGQRNQKATWIAGRLKKKRSRSNQKKNQKMAMTSISYLWIIALLLTAVVQVSVCVVFFLWWWWWRPPSLS